MRHKMGIVSGDIIIMKKKHPCGSDEFRVLYAASDVKLECTGCGRQLIIARSKLEKSVKKVVSGG